MNRLSTYNRVAALLAEFKPDFRLNKSLENLSESKLEEVLQSLQQQQATMYQQQDDFENFLRS